MDNLREKSVDIKQTKKNMLKLNETNKSNKRKQSNTHSYNKNVTDNTKSSKQNYKTTNNAKSYYNKHKQ